MSEKTKQLKEMLFNQKKNGIDVFTEDELNACDEFCEGYKEFLRMLRRKTDLLNLTNSAAHSTQATKFITQTEARQLFFALKAKEALRTA